MNSIIEVIFMSNKNKKTGHEWDFIKRMHGRITEEEMAKDHDIEMYSLDDYPIIQNSIEEEAELEKKRKRSLGLL